MKTKWTYENCKECAKTCKNRGEFWDKFSWAAHLSKINGWDNDFFEKNKNNPPGFWSEDNCIKESKKYKTTIEFRDNSPTAFWKSKKNNWLFKMAWLKDTIKKFDTVSTIHLVYGYFVTYNGKNYVYIGRTFQLKQRDYAHRKKTKKRDAIRDFCAIINIEIPKPIILEENLTLIESQEKENFYVDLYKKLGYVVLNIGKTGKNIGSIGGAGIKWDYESCYEEALKYKTKIEFYKGSNGAWCKARKYGWLKDYTWLYSPQRPKKYWNYETCMEAAKKCNIINELRNNYEEAYKIARKNGWIKDYTWFKELRHRYTEEEVIMILKQCNSVAELRKKFAKAYNYICYHKAYHLYKYIGRN